MYTERQGCRRNRDLIGLSPIFACVPARRHHFVPQWYLRQFAKENRVGVLDKQTGRFEVRHVRRTAVVEGLYDIDHADLSRESIEELLADVESKAAVVIRRIASDGLEWMMPRDRMVVADFAAAQFLRVPAHRAGLVQSVHRELDRVRAHLTDDEVIEMAGAPLTREQIDLVRGPQLSPNVVDGAVGGGVMMFLEEHSRDLRSDRWTWAVERVDQPMLVTSDVPISAIGGDPRSGNSGYADLPLDPSTVLVFRSGATAASIRSSRDFYLGPDGRVSATHFQRLMINRADRWIFGHPDNPLWSTL